MQLRAHAQEPAASRVEGRKILIAIAVLYFWLRRNTAVTRPAYLAFLERHGCTPALRSWCRCPARCRCKSTSRTPTPSTWRESTTSMESRQTLTFLRQATAWMPMGRSCTAPPWRRTLPTELCRCVDGCRSGMDIGYVGVRPYRASTSIHMQWYASPYRLSGLWAVPGRSVGNVVACGRLSHVCYKNTSQTHGAKISGEYCPWKCRQY